MQGAVLYLCGGCDAQTEVFAEGQTTSHDFGQVFVLTPGRLLVACIGLIPVALPQRRLARFKELFGTVFAEH